ncbi:MAG: Ig-like domain-containing protein, partial [Pseudomonadota bacterium]
MSFGKFDKSDFDVGIETLIAGPDGRIVIPETRSLFDAEFQRLGDDLYLHQETGPALRIEGYFAEPVPIDLYAANGSVLRGGAVERLAGPEAPGQYAQSGPAVQSGPIGQVETLSGSASVQRTDGTVETLQVGSKIAQNDVLTTQADGNVSVTFVDGTIFTLASNSRMIVDDLVYDPGSDANSGGFSLIQGSFVFIAGQVAQSGGMEVDTPSATMGIRGTTVIVEITTENGVVTSEVSLLTDVDGTKGNIQLFDLQGNLIANISDTDTKWIIDTGDGEPREEPRTLSDDAEDSFLIAEAVAAYQSAVARVEAGQTFVTFGNTGGPGTESPAGPGQSGQGLDAIDEPDAIDPGNNNQQQQENGSDGPVDEGRLRIDGNLEAQDLVITGLEDTSSDDGGVTGVLMAGDPGGTAVFSLVSGPENGVLALQPDGTFAYTPNLNFNGEDRFTFAVSDETGATETGTVTVNILPVNDAPTAEDSAVALSEDGSALGVITGADIDGDPLSYSIETAPASGQLVLLQDGTYAYTPNADFEGTDSFQVRVSDPDGAFDIAQVNVTVSAVNDVPVISTTPGQDQGAIIEDGPGNVVSGQLTATDADNGAVLTWTGSTDGTYGTFAIATDGSWTFTLDQSLADQLSAGEVATETFLATVSDENGASVSQQVSVTIDGANDAAVVSGT